MEAKVPEVQSWAPPIGLVSVKATTVQVASFGPYRVKVIVPVGLVPRVRCATSFTDPPATTEPLAVSPEAHPSDLASPPPLASSLLLGPAQLASRWPHQ